MDALALLCTLHADGPTTLKRLRAAGCPSLEALLGFEAEELARLIDLPAARSRRLKREARLLAERICGDLLQPEEQAGKTPARPHPGARPAPAPTQHSGHSPGPEPLAPAAAMEPSPSGPWPEDFLPPEPAPAEAAGPGSSLSGVDRRLLGRVLEHWNEKGAAANSGSASAPDALQRPAREAVQGSGSEPVQDPVPEAASGLKSNSKTNAPESPVPIESPELIRAGRPLAEGSIVGLVGVHVERLRALGVTTVEELVAADALALARAIDMPFGALRRAQFLGARDLESQASPQAEAEESVQAVGGTAHPRPETRDASTRGEAKTVLDWSFEIPRPAQDSHSQAEQPGGPFA